MRNNQSFLNRVSFRRRTPVRETPTIPFGKPAANNSPTLKPVPNQTVAAMRSCIDTLSETANISPAAYMNIAQEGSSSGKRTFDYIYEMNEKDFFLNFIF